MACQWRPNTNCTELAGKPGRIQLFDVVENCNLGTDNIGGESIRYGKGIGSFAVYQVSQNNNDYQDSLGYVDGDNKLRQFTTPTNTSTNYYKIPDKIAPTKVNNPYNPAGYTITNAEECQSACNENSECTGVQFVKASKQCSLSTDLDNELGKTGLKATGVNTNTYFDFPGADLYIRTKGNNNNASCPKNSTAILSDDWKTYNRGPNMEMETPCGVSTEIISKLGDIQQIMQDGQNLVVGVENKINELNSVDNTLTKDLESKTKELKQIMKDYESTYDELITYQKDGSKVELLDRMQDNSKYSLDSSKLKYTILNILAVLFIIGLFFVYRMKPSVSKMSTIKMPGSLPKMPNPVK